MSRRECVHAYSCVRTTYTQLYTHHIHTAVVYTPHAYARSISIQNTYTPYAYIQLRKSHIHTFVYMPLAYDCVSYLQKANEVATPYVQLKVYVFWLMCSYYLCAFKNMYGIGAWAFCNYFVCVQVTGLPPKGYMDRHSLITYAAPLIASM